MIKSASCGTDVVYTDTRMSLCKIFRMKIQTGGEQGRSRDSTVRYARKNDGGEGTENKNVKARPISMSNRYGVLLFASPEICCSPSFNFHYRSLFLDLICCPVRSTYIRGFYCPTRNYFLPAVGSYHRNADSFARFALKFENCLTVFLETTRI